MAGQQDILGMQHAPGIMPNTTYDSVPPMAPPNQDDTVSHAGSVTDSVKRKAGYK